MKEYKGHFSKKQKHNNPNKTKLNLKNKLGDYSRRKYNNLKIR